MERLTGHTELQELLGAYALDAVEPEEAAAIENHLPTCPRCRNELADHREVAALLGYAGGAAPDGVWDRIIASLEEPPPALLLTRAPTNVGPSSSLGDGNRTTELFGQPPSEAAVASSAADRDGEPDLFSVMAGGWGPKWPPPIHTRESGPDAASDNHDNVVPIDQGRAATRSRRTVPMRFMVAFATAAAVIVAALGVEVGRLDVHRSQQVTNLSALAYRAADADPSARHLTLSSPDGVHTVRAVIIADGTTYLGPGNLETLPSDETYQMWSVVNGNRVSLGPIGDSPTYTAFPTPATATVLAMTIETRGGVATSTKTPVVAGVVPTA